MMRETATKTVRCSYPSCLKHAHYFTLDDEPSCYDHRLILVTDRQLLTGASKRRKNKDTLKARLQRGEVPRASSTVDDGETEARHTRLEALLRDMRGETPAEPPRTRGA